jgi:hypothetical protein
VRSIGRVYRAVPTEMTTLASTAPIAVPVTPSRDDATAADAAASALPTICETLRPSPRRSGADSC